MIVGTCFVCDDMSVGWRQHDVYPAALEIIVLRVNRFTLAARHILSDVAYPVWGTINQIDHRTLQSAHDLLAAAWRWQFLGVQCDLLTNFSTEYDALEKEWLDWLADEVDSWIDAPELIRLFQIIIANQNETAGYAAEAKLSIALLDRFSDVRWNPDVRTAHETDLARHAPDVFTNVAGPSKKNNCQWNTYRFPRKSDVRYSDV